MLPILSRLKRKTGIRSVERILDMIHRRQSEFNGAVDLSWSPTDQGAAVRVFLKFDAPPTTPGDIEVIYNSGDGANYDTLIEKIDPSVDGLTDIAMLIGNETPLFSTDAIQVKYPNTNTRRVNVTIIGADDYF